MTAIAVINALPYPSLVKYEHKGIQSIPKAAWTRMRASDQWSKQMNVLPLVLRSVDLRNIVFHSAATNGYFISDKKLNHIPDGIMVYPASMVVQQ